MSHPVIFITGAAKRIGACLAKRFHQHGYRVVIHYRNSHQHAMAVIDELNADRPNSAMAIQGDLEDIDTLASIAQQAVSCFGRLDMLINNASAFYPTPIEDVTLNDWHALVGSNLQGPLFLIKACLPALKEFRGNIINMIDIHATRPLPQHSIYCLAKSGLQTLTLSLAQDLAPEIRVNGISPGAILWPDTALSDAEQASILSDIPMGELGTPEDIAQAALYFANARYVTGQILSVDGGRSISSHARA